VLRGVCVSVWAFGPGSSVTLQPKWRCFLHFMWR